MAGRLDIRGVDWVGQAIRSQQTVGGKLADLLHALAGFIRAREEIRREVDVLTAEGRVSAYILGALPIGLAAFVQVSNPGYLDPMFEGWRSEEHTSELQSLMRISYAVFCLKKKKNTIHKN